MHHTNITLLPYNKHYTTCIQQIYIQNDGVDLLSLTTVLSSKEQVADPDVRWDFDSLFASLKSQIIIGQNKGGLEEKENSN